MPRACTVCQHPQRPAIEGAVVAGESAPRIAAIHRVSDDAITRHRRHMLVPLQEAQAVRAAVTADQAEQVQQALNVVQQLKAINSASLAVLREARVCGDGDLALKAVDRVQRQIELQAKLLGDLDERPVVNVLVSSEWVAVRAVLLEALAPYPEARAAVAGRLVALEGA